MDLRSKKLLVTLITIAILIVKALVPQLEALDEQAVMAYLVGQGIADHGKEKAKIENKHFEEITRELDIVGE